MPPAAVPSSEAWPLKAWRRQGKAKLAPPTPAAYEGKTVLLIGATGVILSDAARILASLKIATLILGVRNVKKGEVLADTLRPKHADVEIKTWEVDLFSFESVKRFVATINEYGRIDAIVMGSAIINKDTKLTKDGWEETLLIVLILPKLLAANADNDETAGGSPPVVLSSVSSLSIRSNAPFIKLPATAKESYLAQLNRVDTSDADKRNQYGFAKIVHTCWLRDLCARLPSPEIANKKIQIHSVDPGVCPSPLSKFSIFSKMFLLWVGRPVEMSARAVVNSCLPIPGSHGKLLLDYDVVPYPEYMDRELGLELRRRVWSETKQVLIDTFPETEPFFASLSEPAVSPK
ncbi:short-chain dehydrogenase/reductase family protein [Apiospora phragmitis]|uniref:Short-chain dehydrogenase/reductase family protein n=1 Tax=Apiospora phragmitis TaxID=2905665 RepID=A0ABR1TAV6_9PEZI